MREIKFRFWDEIQKTMHYPSPKFPLCFPLLPFIMEKTMQFTGLKDKNGKEIYEGDIIKGEKFDPPIMICVWDKNHALCFEFIDKYGEKDSYDLSLHDIFEVIGNIYENPELLQAEKCPEVKE